MYLIILYGGDNMKKIYACLAGNWVDLSTDSFAFISTEELKPVDWFEKNNSSKTRLPNFVLIRFHSCFYWINPIFIQALE